MDSFSSPSSAGSTASTEQLMEQIKAQLAQAYAQEFLEVRLLEPSSDRRVSCAIAVCSTTPLLEIWVNNGTASLKLV
ncbi:hypothetical protein E2562_009848 [Oryza meyeriana var. granulata]|uniref:Uncharacterized protein n=1 Tax=Oryza meyeriana var. granulata TaxID=110450 RepID=A0A6G1BUI8_9ORYZ|nr:hypothetical protein E2562_009848 [Oryza meyeriana var. granulata]